ncbi:MAG: hypothetical protein AAF230_03160, partial [Pseudomonadota bacterium]
MPGAVGVPGAAVPEPPLPDGTDAMPPPLDVVDVVGVVDCVDGASAAVRKPPLVPIEPPPSPEPPALSEPLLAGALRAVLLDDPPIENGALSFP